MTDNKQYPPLPDAEEVEQYVYRASRRYIPKDVIEPIHELMRAYVDADRAMRAANTKRQYYWRVGRCRASDAYASNCICWHDEGTGPMAGKIDWAMVDWRDVPAPASHERDEAINILVRFAEGLTTHNYSGACPSNESPKSRDPQCMVCWAIDAACAAKEGQNNG